MASTEGFLTYVCGQIQGAGHISSRKMFGEYVVYCDSKVIGLVCDNQFFVKKTAAGAEMELSLEELPPYEGARPHFVVDFLDNEERAAAFVKATCSELPMPKPKKKKC